MIRTLTSSLSASHVFLCTTIAITLFSPNSFANPLMSKEQYADYSVRYQCAEILFHNNLQKKEAELIKIEDQYGLTDDNFDAFDELITEYERDDTLLDTVRERITKECSS
ncbi:hypothetical protein A3740_03845 [Oleiphilus sp. HI0068]|jgi:phosphopantetheine adenylyltransferase|uniref:hypothetical protein n=1 Tax=unclassified Oleiphilus TaxID=2631174 RepID=UPI0007C2A724|nr:MULTISPECIES: hypothetical protein [unclassified Oleiphilus]KZY72877.1 hypothetical protein A3740_03845 [Oleiphilus sp. HI0068]KZY77718.1 hypothetical protein A3741_09305 [Oleiphilus sp. HI0069]KZZ44388.1 hypothetical protein A3755_03315 [Oleiphilus sp. HI0085]KZY62623.1 hypothetical protein A3735_01530 [Oleiphilus sp. HI0061]KZY65400.1 hypothetical protein A3735_24225 [Oleiphilus sp. HI0061]